MNASLICSILAASLALSAATTGCAYHDGRSPDMQTRTYHLRDPRDTEVVTRALDREYVRSGVRSSSSVTPSGDVLVQTTPRGHAAVRDALTREGR
ncbi:MAG: hypothetical protein JWN40_3085 [Phycisphaerales bacterium]|nr:hypothetical protein [Phycisphaerales bacterium]